MIPASFTYGGIAKDISRELMLTTGLVQQPVQIVASHDLTLFVGQQYQLPSYAGSKLTNGV